MHRHATVGHKASEAFVTWAESLDIMLEDHLTRCQSSQSIQVCNAVGHTAS